MILQPPTVSITSPGEGATVSGIVTVEATVSDTGGSGISHSVLYANDTLVAVNTTSTTNPIFKLDTSMLDSGDCKLTVVAVDNAMNSNWTEVNVVVVNVPPDASFTYSQSSPDVVISISQPEGITDYGSSNFDGVWQTSKPVGDTITAVDVSTGWRSGYEVWVTIEDLNGTVLGTSEHNLSVYDYPGGAWTHLEFASPVRVTAGETYKIVGHDPVGWGGEGVSAAMNNPYPDGRFGGVLSFMTYLKHQKSLPCPRMFSNSLCHAGRPLDVSDPFRSFNRQCGMVSDKIGVALVEI